MWSLHQSERVYHSEITKLDRRYIILWKYACFCNFAQDKKRATGKVYELWDNHRICLKPNVKAGLIDVCLNRRSIMFNIWIFILEMILIHISVYMIMSCYTFYLKECVFEWRIIRYITEHRKEYKEYMYLHITHDGIKPKVNLV